MTDAVACATCAKTESDLNKSLKHCAKCKSIRYCSRECQQQDWKVHKKVCASKAASPANNSSGISNNDRPSASANSSSTASTATMYDNLQKQIEQPFHKLSQKKWLHDRPEEDVFKLLLDAYRLRVNDDYNMLGEIDVDFLEGDQVRPFRRFLSKAEKRSGLLPDWWSMQKSTQCILYGKHSQDHSWATMPEKSDIMEYYGNRTMPMQLRMLAEQVYGSGPGGQAGAAMMEMMVKSEEGTIHSVLL